MIGTQIWFSTILILSLRNHTHIRTPIHSLWHTSVTVLLTSSRLPSAQPVLTTSLLTPLYVREIPDICILAMFFLTKCAAENKTSACKVGKQQRQCCCRWDVVEGLTDVARWRQWLRMARMSTSRPLQMWWRDNGNLLETPSRVVWSEGNGEGAWVGT